MSKNTGGCLCKKVRYEFKGEPTFSANCYCRQCQQATGSSYTTVIGTQEADFELVSGDLGEHTVTADSGNWVTRLFCKDCGSPLFTRAEAAPGAIFIKAVSLDEPAAVKPSINVYTSAAQPWGAIADAEASFEKMPPHHD